MLKLIPPATNCGCGYFKSKCAEIHYQTSNLTILCIFCGMSTLVYTEFLEHFHSQHLEDFRNALRNTSEPVVTTVFESTSMVRRAHNDPLEFGEREVTDDPDEVLKMLQASRDELKESNAPAQSEECSTKEVESRCQEDVIVQQQLEELTKSEDEYLIREIKVEQSGFTLDPAAAFDESADSYSSDNVASPIGVQANEGATTDPEAAAIAGVDWSKPFQPNLLKNHDKRPYKPRNKPNICNYCGRTFRRRYQLDTHLNIHTGLKPHQCEICGRQFRAITTLTRHLSTHEQREAHHCKYCTKSFTHRAALLSHELRHTQQRRIPCDECDKYFYTNNQMDTHKRKVHHKADDNDLPFSCELCTKRYRSASMLSTHKFKKHYKTAKIFCEQCGKKFIDKVQLEAHNAIHISNRTVFQ